MKNLSAIHILTADEVDAVLASCTPEQKVVYLTGYLTGLAGRLEHLDDPRLVELAAEARAISLTLRGRKNVPEEKK